MLKYHAFSYFLVEFLAYFHHENLLMMNDLIAE